MWLSLLFLVVEVVKGLYRDDEWCLWDGILVGGGIMIWFLVVYCWVDVFVVFGMNRFCFVWVELFLCVCSLMLLDRFWFVGLFVFIVFFIFLFCRIVVFFEKSMFFVLFVLMLMDFIVRCVLGYVLFCLFVGFFSFFMFFIGVIVVVWGVEYLLLVIIGVFFLMCLVECVEEGLLGEVVVRCLVVVWVKGGCEVKGLRMGFFVIV